METKQLTQELIPEVTKGGNDALVRQVQAALEQAEATGRVLYVHYEENWLQWVSVDQSVVDDREVQEKLQDDAWWGTRLGRLIPS